MGKPPMKTDNKQMLGEVQMHRRRADIAEKQVANLKVQLDDLKRVTPLDAINATRVRDALVALLACNENLHLDKDGKFMPNVGKELKLAITNARLAIKLPNAVKVEAPPAEAVPAAPAAA